ncbi:MAG: cytochrome c [Pseudoxanthomonas suwonensis]|nr:cytochrome c [Pseudoxanthomonas suwonensis]
MIRTLPAVSLALLLAACSGGQADPAAASRQNVSSAGLPSGDAARGEALALRKSAASGQTCIDCHGENGNSPIDENTPKIGGQYHDYLAHALQRYRDGRRDHALMSSQAVDLGDQEIADLAMFFGSRPTQLVNLEQAHK